MCYFSINLWLLWGIDSHETELLGFPGMVWTGQKARQTLNGENPVLEALPQLLHAAGRCWQPGLPEPRLGQSSIVLARNVREFSLNC